MSQTLEASRNYSHSILYPSYTKLLLSPLAFRYSTYKASPQTWVKYRHTTLITTTIIVIHPIRHLEATVHRRHPHIHLNFHRTIIMGLLRYLNTIRQRPVIVHHHRIIIITNIIE